MNNEIEPIYVRQKTYINDLGQTKLTAQVDCFKV